ncbi:MAG TPA: LOG family protein [Patescibacteria group bacterium]|nr:LOG family protein [Patescibacteria group bacterium]
MRLVSVLGSSRCEADSFEYSMAERAGELLARAGMGVITGGYGGVMEAALKGAAQCDGKCIGVTTAFYKNLEKNKFVQREVRTNSYNDYLMQIIDLSDAFIVLPGSVGTLFEFSAIWALMDVKAIKQKPAVCVGEQWKEIAQLMAFYSQEAQQSVGMFTFVESPQEAVDAVENFLKTPAVS